MRRVAIFVDAGYFWVQCCTQVLNRSDGNRSDIVIDYEKMRSAFLKEVLDQFSGAHLLRAYWYDGPGGNGSKTQQHKEIDRLNDFKLRLGTRNREGAQKGVDGLIIADLISLTQLKAITDALLVTGDADIAPGVVAAQDLGLRVHLLSLGPGDSTSPYLSAEVDYKHSWGENEILAFAAESQSIAQDAAAVATTVAVDIAQVASSALPSIQGGIHSALFAPLKRNTPSIPREIDGQLLSYGRTALGRELELEEKKTLRKEFKKLLPQ